MPIKRVYVLSKELNIPEKELTTLLNSLGAKVRGPMSIVAEDIQEKLQVHLSSAQKEKEKQKELEKEKRLAEKGLRIKEEKEKKEREKEKVTKKEKPAKEKRKRIRVSSEEQPDEFEVFVEEERHFKTKKKKIIKTDESADRRKKDRERLLKFAVEEDELPEIRKVKKKKEQEKKEERDQREVQEIIRQTMAKTETGKKTKRYKKKVKEESTVEDSGRPVIKIGDLTSVADLAKMLNTSNAELIKKCLEMGLMVTVNQRLDFDTVSMIADEFQFDVELVDLYLEEETEETEIEEGELIDRAPVVTIMGHVDHGKTSLLDHIRKSNIISTEAGGITQHIGAYSIITHNRKITFIDTPGHEAFTNMRARGAQATDVVVLVIACNDRVMPQTIEAIDHAKAAKVPIIVALNKIDLPSADPNRIRADLAKNNLVVEEFGGQVISVEISAKTGIGVDKLLEMILLQADILELKTAYDGSAKGIILEAQLDRGRGPVATVLVQKGTLRAGDAFVAGDFSGKVRAMFDDLGQKIDEAPPSTPVEVLGFNGVPLAGDIFKVMHDERAAKQLSSERLLLKRERQFKKRAQVSLENLYNQIKAGDIKELNIIIKADTVGSVEALSDSLQRLNNEEVKLNIIHQGIGAVTENDVNLASASAAIIISFYVTAPPTVRELANQHGVDIRYYRVIFEVIDDLRKALEGMLTPETREEIIGQAEVRVVYNVPRVGTIAGSYVKEGYVNRNARVRIIRNGIVVHESTVSSLKRFKDDAKEVQTGFECGIGIDNYNDIKENDIFEFYKITEFARKLE